MWSEGPRGVAWLGRRRSDPRGGRLWTLGGRRLRTFQQLPQTGTLASCSASEVAAQNRCRLDALVCAAMGCGGRVGSTCGRPHVLSCFCAKPFLFSVEGGAGSPRLEGDLLVGTPRAASTSRSAQGATGPAVSQTRSRVSSVGDRGLVAGAPTTRTSRNRPPDGRGACLPSAASAPVCRVVGPVDSVSWTHAGRTASSRARVSAQSPAGRRHKAGC